MNQGEVSEAGNLASDDTGLVFSWRGATKYIPLAVCGGFFLFSILWVALGPIDWKIDNPLTLGLFLFGCSALLFLGYLLGIRGRAVEIGASKARTIGRGRLSFKLPLDPSRVLIACGVVYLVLYLPTVYATTGKPFPDVWTGLTNPAAAYHGAKDFEGGAGSALLYIRFLFGPFLVLITPITFFLYPKLTRTAKILGVACLVLSLALSIAQGVNRGVAEQTAYIVLLMVLIFFSSLRKGLLKRRLMALGGAALAIALFFGYYSINISSRLAYDAQVAASARPGEKPKPDPGGPTAEQINQSASAGGAGTAKQGHPLLGLPTRIAGGTIVLSSYVTHGYKGLSMALQQPWKPTYGLGFSEFVRHNVTKVIGGPKFEQQMVERSYAGQLIKDGWPTGLLWATFFVHPASDISFPGVVVLMFAIGWVFARSWRDTVTRSDPLAAGVFLYLCTLVIYLPANNQLYQGGELAIGFTTILVAWLIGRRLLRPAAEAKAEPVGDQD